MSHSISSPGDPHRVIARRYPELARALPFFLIIGGIAFDSAVRSLRLELPWDLRWDYAARNLLALIALLVLAPGLPELTGTAQAAPRWTTATALAWSFAVGALVLLVWIAAPMQAFSLSSGGLDLARLTGHAAAPLAGSGFRPLDAQGGLDWPLALSRWAGSTLVVPLAEELFWRSLAMRWIDTPKFAALSPTATSFKALGLQAIAFGLEHDLWIAGIIAGLAYGGLYRRSGRLWTAILAHTLTNGLLGVWVLWNQQWSYW